MTTDPGGTLAAVFVALYAAHSVGDHWIQTEHQAATKGRPGWVGRLAGARHVATLTAAQLAALLVLAPTVGVHLHIGQMAAGLAVNALTHWWADRRSTLARLAAAAGLRQFYALGWCRAGRDDNPSLGTGAYALDQSFHIGWLFVAALIISA